MTVLVTGATGFVGGHVAAALLRSGADVRALVRDPSRLAPGPVAVRGDLTDSDSVAAACAGADLAVHCAAVTTNNVAWDVHRRVNVEGTRTLLEAARAAGVRRVVHLSSVAVYGVAAAPGPLDESAPYGDGGDRWAYYLRSKAEADRLALAASGDGLEVVVLRPGVVHGPGRAGVLVPALGGARGVRVTIGSRRKAVPLVHVDDVAAAVALALEAPGAAGQAFNLVAEPQLEARRLAAMVGERLIGLPAWPFERVAERLEARSAAADAETPPRLSRYQVAQQARDARYATGKARERLGWAPAPTEDGVRRTLAAASP